jgi:hypothetical protein
MHLRRPTLLSLLPFLLAAACKPAADSASLPKSDVPESYFLAAAPAQAQPVADVVSSAKDGDLVAVVGRVGGAQKVFVDDYAVFTLVDSKIEPCGAGRMDECETPWDYCCDTPEVIAANALSVELVADNQVLKASPRGFHGLDVLKTVVVQGKVARDGAGNVRVLATGLHVEP